jgi:carboxymethylenebutenolidase
MEIETADLRYPGHGGDPIDAFLARPAGAGPWPGVVVAHEVYGPTEHTRSVARRFASEGFAALAPDLWTRDRPVGALPAADADLGAWKAFVGTVPDARIVGDLAAAARALRARPEVRRDAVGVAGFSMGGIYAFHLACEPGAVQACVDLYGRIRYDAPSPLHPKGNLDRVAELRCPFLGVFGAMDHLIPLKDMLALKESLGGRGHVIAYPRAGHSFLDESKPSYREEDAKDAWRRMLLFLRERLAPDTLPPDAGPAVPEYRPPAGKKGGRGGKRR